MDRPSYRYYPLNEEESQFRLVTILPGNWADEVQCTLKTWSWDGRPSYEALSYVWGNASDRRRIWLDNTPFYATANLEHALRFIRQPYPRTLWIDAICVNQEDLEERSSQVQLMRRTYREASNVVLWIGNEGAESRLAFHLLHLVDKLVNGPNPPAAANLPYAMLELVEREPTGQRAVASLYYDILMRPYWERAWIIQEVAVASKGVVQCGQIAMPWITFLNSFITILTSSIQPPDFEQTNSANGIQCLKNMANIYSNLNDKNEQRITTLVANSRSSSATDPRDCVFALVGLATGLNHLIIPNYSASLSAREVFINLVEHSVTEESNLDLISLSQGRDSRLGLPTWVPDWSEKLEYIPTSNGKPVPLLNKYFHNAQIENEWHASGSLLPDITIQRPSGVLNCKGIAIDTIIEACPPLQHHEDCLRPWTTLVQRRLATLTVSNPREPNLLSINTQYDAFYFPNSSIAHRNNLIPQEGTLRKLFGSKTQTKQNNGGQYLTGEPLVEACVRTLSTDRLFNMRRITSNVYWRFWTDPINPNTQNPVTEPDSRVDISHSITMRGMNRRPFISQYGYMGMAGVNIRAGDIICILFGCSVPVVLRPQGGYFTFVSETYVHGLMDGQAIQQLNTGRLKAQMFDIR